MSGNRSRLPQWAQRELESLERHVAYLEAKLTEGPEDADTFVRGITAADRPLGREVPIRFQLGEDRYDLFIQARITRGVVEIHGGRAFNVKPRSSNVVEIELDY